jgi:hypothetical protein
MDPNQTPLPHPDAAAKEVDPFILWPYNLASPSLNGLPSLMGFAQVPAAPFEPMFGTSWLPNRPARGGWDPQYPGVQEGLAPGVNSIAQHLAHLESNATALVNVSQRAPTAVPVPMAGFGTPGTGPTGQPLQIPALTAAVRQALSQSAWRNPAGVIFPPANGNAPAAAPQGPATAANGMAPAVVPQGPAPAATLQLPLRSMPGQRQPGIQDAAIAAAGPVGPVPVVLPGPFDNPGAGGAIAGTGSLTIAGNPGSLGLLGTGALPAGTMIGGGRPGTVGPEQTASVPLPSVFGVAAGPTGTAVPTDMPAAAPAESTPSSVAVPADTPAAELPNTIPSGAALPIGTAAAAPVEPTTSGTAVPTAIAGSMPPTDLVVTIVAETTPSGTAVPRDLAAPGIIPPNVVAPMDINAASSITSVADVQRPSVTKYAPSLKWLHAAPSAVRFAAIDEAAVQSSVPLEEVGEVMPVSKLQAR